MNLPWNYSDKNSPQNDQWLPCYFLKIQAMGDNDTAEHMLDPEKDSTHEDGQRPPHANTVLGGSLSPKKHGRTIEGTGWDSRFFSKIKMLNIHNLNHTNLNNLQVILIEI